MSQDSELMRADALIGEVLGFLEGLMTEGSLHGASIGCAAAAYGALAFLVRYQKVLPSKAHQNFAGSVAFKTPIERSFEVQDHLLSIKSLQSLLKGKR